jgi:hypothetical protein
MLRMAVAPSIEHLEVELALVALVGVVELHGGLVELGPRDLQAVAHDREGAGLVGDQERGLGLLAAGVEVEAEQLAGVERLLQRRVELLGLERVDDLGGGVEHRVGLDLGQRLRHVERGRLRGDLLAVGPHAHELLGGHPPAILGEVPLAGHAAHDEHGAVVGELGALARLPLGIERHPLARGIELLAGDSRVPEGRGLALMGDDDRAGHGFLSTKGAEDNRVGGDGERSTPRSRYEFAHSQARQEPMPAILVSAAGRFTSVS